MKQVSEKEYSPEQTLAIRTQEIHENAIKAYIESLDSQYNNLKILHDEIKSKLKLIEKASK